MKKILLITLLSSLCFSDELPSNCIEPAIPMKFKNQNEYNSFNSAAQMYLLCVKEFTNEQKAIASKHIDSAQRAYDKFNSFVDKTNSSAAFANSIPAKASNIKGEKSSGSNSPTKFSTGFSF